MHVTFLGAVREVTGSMHLISTASDRILLDCGLHQGRRRESERKNREFPIHAGKISNVVLSHAHIDHSGRLPVLTRSGFKGRIIATRASVAACGYLLPDSARIQESDALYLNYKSLRKYLYEQEHRKRKKKLTHREVRNIKKQLKRDGHRLNEEAIHRLMDKHGLYRIRPLYTSEEADEALNAFDGIPYNHTVTVGKNITCTLYDAGHILGSAISIIKVLDGGKHATICYTGDVGRFNKPILNDPTLEFAEEDRDVDLLIMESTYGNRLHEPVKDLKKRLREALNNTFRRGGNVLIPSFAFGRTQELLYVIHELYDQGEVERVPIHVDSPLAVKLTRVFGEHPEDYDEDTHAAFLEKGENPFFFKEVRFVRTVDESIALMRETKPHIVISASGMCEAGRILHHLRYKIHNPRNTILIVGFMAQHTLGRRILDNGLRYEVIGREGPPPEMKILKKRYPLKARVVALDGFSAHADQNELMHLLKKSNLKVKKIALVHGEVEQSVALSDRLRENGYPVFIPKPGEKYAI